MSPSTLLLETWRKHAKWTIFDLHIHTCFSLDSVIQPKRLLLIARKRGLRGIAVTDHNTIKGGVSVARQRRFNDFFVVVGSEIRTEHGEIIGLFLNEEVKARNAFCVIDEVRAQGGITVLPHPFRTKILPHHYVKEKHLRSELLERMDLFEVLNGRTSYWKNLEALRLAMSLRKPMIAGSDAHFYSEIGDVQTVFDHVDSEEELRVKILKGQMRLRQTSSIFMGNLHFYVLSAVYGKFREALFRVNLFKFLAFLLNVT